VQDVFVRVLQHRGTLPAIRDLRPWLVRIAWNLALDRRRRIQPDQLDDLATSTLKAAHLPADQALDDHRRFTTVFRAIDALPKPERQALLLSALEELDTAEIARIMGKTESAVRALIFRARTRLRSRIDTNSRNSTGGRA
jgi:RNA polymerase sigma-70 factor (ECF subfamily)